VGGRGGQRRRCERSVIANEPSSSTVFTVIEGTDTTVTVLDGFTQLSFQYASDFDVGDTVFGGLSGDGEVLTAGTLPATGVCTDSDLEVEGEFPFCGDPTGFVGVWGNYTAPEFEGTVARSIAFVGPGNDHLLTIDDMLLSVPPRTRTTSWVWDPATDKPVRELLDGSATCLPRRVRPCALPEAAQKEGAAPYFLWGDNPATRDVFRNAAALSNGMYRLTSTIDSASAIITFEQAC
jgi:hypothetical protein